MALQGARQLQARLNAIGETQVLLRRIQIRGVAEAKVLVPRKTGNLARTIRVGEVTKNSAQVMAGGSLNVGYAAAVERGRGPVTIRPKAGRQGRNGGPAFLAWGGDRRLSGNLRKGASATNFAREVHQKARAPHPYLVPGLKTAAEQEGVTGIVTIWNGAA
jgi:hypothetical protein